MIGQQISFALLLAGASSTMAFSPMSSLSRSQQVQQRLTPLNVGVTWGVGGSEGYYSSDEALSLMDRARNCAYSDSCSLEEATSYLDNILHVQSDCVSGELVGQDLCENQDVVADVVAHLREKIASQKEKMVALSAVKATSQVAIAVAAVMATIVAVSVTAAPHQQLDVTPFTLQEWWWALKGGYFNTMLEYYFRHGGLLMDNADANALSSTADAVSPFTMQEWMWALQGGYLKDMIDFNFRHGGLLVGSSDAVVSPTVQEWVWAFQGRYLDTMMDHVAKNGGLASGNIEDVSAIPFTPQEWMWAVKGGYFNTMMEHYIRNGGV